MKTLLLSWALGWFWIQIKEEKILFTIFTLYHIIHKWWIHSTSSNKTIVLMSYSIITFAIISNIFMSNDTIITIIVIYITIVNVTSIFISMISITVLSILTSVVYWELSISNFKIISKSWNFLQISLEIMSFI